MAILFEIKNNPYTPIFSLVGQAITISDWNFWIGRDTVRNQRGLIVHGSVECPFFIYFYDFHILTDQNFRWLHFLLKFLTKWVFFVDLN